MSSGAIITIPNAYKSANEHLENLRPRLDPSHANIANSVHQAATMSFTAAQENSDTKVRRPLSGISVKPNTRATVQIVNKTTGVPIKIFNELGSSNPRNSPDIKAKIFDDDGKKLRVPVAAGADFDAINMANPQNLVWTDFFLSKVGEAREEKIQLTETFGDPILYVFGEKPRFLSFKGFLMNTQDFNWRAQFWENWDKYFRASKLVEGNNQMTLFFDDIHVRGYPINAVCQQTSDSPNVMVFSFNFYVVDYVNRYMVDVAKLHKMRLPKAVFTYKGLDPNSAKTKMTQYVVRPGEYISEGGYDGGTRRVPLMVRTMEGKLVKAGSADDPLVKMGRRKKGDIIVDSTRVLYENVFASNIDFAKRAWESTTYPSGGRSDSDPASKGQVFGGYLLEKMFSPMSKSITSPADAMAFMTNYLSRKARRLMHAGLADSAKTTHKWSGGRRRMSAIFGTVTHLYKVAVRNGVLIAGGQSKEFGKLGRWANLIDAMATSGSVNDLADYVGYAIQGLGGKASKELTAGTSQDYAKLNGMKYSINEGYTRDHSKSFNFSDLSSKGEGATSASAVLFGQSNQTFTGADSGGVGAGEIEELLESNDGADQPSDSQASSAEQQDAAAQQAAGQEPTSDGAFTEVPDSEEGDDDGGEE
jgi:hypothetical protein